MNLNRMLTTCMLGMTAMIAVSAEPYPINYDVSTTIEGKRSLNKVNLRSPGIGDQSVAVNQADDKLLYHDLTNRAYVVLPSETVYVDFDWSGQWMHGYVYIDRGNDGDFSHEVGTKSAIPDGSDIMAFSNYDGYNSVGERTRNGNVGVTPPSFTIPSDLTPGLYRMRVKIDWNSIDPGGNTENGVQHSQTIVSNNGAIADFMVMVAEAERSVTVNSEHGTVTLEDGTPLTTDNVTSGSPLTIRFNPEDGYTLASAVIEGGFEFDSPEGFEFADGIGLKNSVRLIGALVENNQYTIPADLTNGSLTIDAQFVSKGNEPTEGNYESFLEGEKAGEGISSVTVNGKALVFDTKLRHYFSECVLPQLSGERMKIMPVYNGEEKSINLYIDIDQNGVFSEAMGELIASLPVGETSEVILPEGMTPAVYRVRLTAGNDCDVEFLLNIHTSTCSLDWEVINGLTLTQDRKPLPNHTVFGEELIVRVTPALEGFETDKVIVRHGHAVNGPQYIRGNRQWDEYEIPTGEVATIPGEIIDGDILITGDFLETYDSEWTAIMAEEFDGEDIDKDIWDYHPRYGSTWNKRIAITDERPYVNKFRNGHYESYSIPTPPEFVNEKQKIITGAIYSHNRFYLKGGRIECRLRTRGHKGNFPAFWMMPSSSPYGWPNDGEIDIWEQIDDSWTTYHTVHTGWTNQTYGPASRKSPTKSGSTTADPELWHVYTLEWDAEEYLKWYVDGELVFTYENQHWSDGDKYIEEITWPFNKPFYIILNQSVGDGSWAADGDPTFEYLTEFDYVRSYQRKDALHYYTTEEGLVTAGIERVENDTPFEDTPVYFNLQGIQVSSESLRPGLYIEKCGNKIRKIVIH